MVTGIPTPETLRHVDERLEALEDALQADCYDDETIQSIGQSAHWRSVGKMNVIRDLRAWLQPALETEETERQRVAAEESDEARWREAGYTGTPDMALLERIQDGDR
jgi:hypothetical protein